jgi:hypothetical protein
VVPLTVTMLARSGRGAPGSSATTFGHAFGVPGPVLVPGPLTSDVEFCGGSLGESSLPE